MGKEKKKTTAEGTFSSFIFFPPKEQIKMTSAKANRITKLSTSPSVLIL